MTAMRRSARKRLKNGYWNLVELYDELHYPGRRAAIQGALCRAGLHYPIKFSDCASGGDYTPPEAGWMCDTCGHLRLPYRAWLWSTPLGRWIA
jgi:hypothetical protein